VSFGQFRRRPRLAVALALVASFVLLGCGSPGRYVWYTQLPRSEWGSESPEYVIGAGDSISIKVYGQGEVSSTFRVRSDGRVALPFVGEVMAAGKHPSALSRELQGKMKRFFVDPVVTVNVETSQPVTVTTIGELKNTGVIQLDSPPRLLDAIARSGGLSDFADTKRIFVLRQYPSFHRIRFTYRAIIDNENGAAGFLLRTGDIIVVE
jgi:polysaccharide export outer membrane protein